jgi:formylglycine-generating enzyme required for sulfatase activity
MWWDEQRPYPTRAVMGVSWFEAVAYATWLDTRLRARADWMPAGYVVRLPTEAEWEKGARAGDSRTYPWGDEPWDKERANANQTIGRATAVGMYTRGATPAGLHDLGGNVWEWTHTLYRPYPYEEGDGRNATEDTGSRMLRGGSWANSQRYVRCGFRFRSSPQAPSTLIYGLRVVVSLAAPWTVDCGAWSVWLG